MIDAERSRANKARVAFNKARGLMDVSEHEALARWAKEAAVYLRKAGTGQLKGIDSGFVERLLHEWDNKLAG